MRAIILLFGILALLTASCSTSEVESAWGFCEVQLDDALPSTVTTPDQYEDMNNTLTPAGYRFIGSLAIPAGVARVRGTTYECKVTPAGGSWRLVGLHVPGLQIFRETLGPAGAIDEESYRLSYGSCAYSGEKVYAASNTSTPEAAARWSSLTFTPGPVREGSYQGCRDALMKVPKRF